MRILLLICCALKLILSYIWLVTMEKRCSSVLSPRAPCPGQLRATCQPWHTTVNLRHAHLMPDPCRDSAWLALYCNQDNCTFITILDVDPSTVNSHKALETILMSWNDINPAGCTQLGARPLGSSCGQCLLLHHLCRRMSEMMCEQIFAIVPAILSGCVKFAMQLLLDNLQIVKWWKHHCSFHMDCCIHY